ncbi:MAG TPA: DASS family sodium-coupled anion symporter [Candidatus Marinimicrobia bacterium]|jgi:anion transporter|nr:DASS family sodium-coupled anion symporter [Candidatus Neomarinimicrobiota bacterium]HIM26953.1 DASS family sodium-coupled anion symporter [Candidatus Neomarinimicrobiota bacterium]
MPEKDNEQSSSGGFAKTTDFKWLGIGLAIFALIAFIMPMPDSMVLKAEELFKGQAGVDVAMKAMHIKIIIALLSTCVIFFATEAVPMPAVALLIGLVQLFFGITDSRSIVGTYAHDAVWFIAGSLALGATLVKYGLDKRVGMLVINLAGTKTRMIVIGILLGTAIPTAFVGEHAVAAMYVPIAMALYTLTNKSTPAPRLGTLLMVTIAVGCMIGGPMSPTGGARNALMIGFLADYGIEVSFMQWVSMGIFYTACMSVVMAFILPLLFKPEVSDLSEAVGLLKKDLEKHGAMTGKQKLVALIMLAVVVLWIVDKSVTRDILGFSLGLGGVAISGAVVYMLLGLTSWKDYEDKVSWGVIVLYAGCISLGSVFKATGASSWFADQIMSLVAPLGLDSGVGLVILVGVIGAILTNLMSAGATVAVIGPVVLDMAVTANTNPILVGVGLAIATSMAYWLVIGTPASSIVYASGMLESKDFIRMATVGWPAALIVLAIMVAVYWVGILGINPLGSGF